MWLQSKKTKIVMLKECIVKRVPGSDPKELVLERGKTYTVSDHIAQRLVGDKRAVLFQEEPALTMYDEKALKGAPENK